MSRPTAQGGSALGTKTVLAFLVGVVIGLALVAPVIPETAGLALGDSVQSAGSVIAVGVIVFALLMVILTLLYQSYLKA